MKNSCNEEFLYCVFGKFFLDLMTEVKICSFQMVKSKQLMPLKHAP